jgi:lysophospholipase L1-like esterase
VIVTLAAVELGIRIFSPQTHFTVAVNVWDRQLGLRQIPNCRGCLRTPEFDMEIVISSGGLRDREYSYAKPDSTRRILCLGDSFTFGYGVEWDETFAKILEGQLDRAMAGGTHWQVLNAGISGTGTANQLAYLNSEGLKYDPDFVVLCFCGANDFFDNGTYGLYTLDDGRLVRHDARLTGPVRLRRMMQHLPGYRTLFGRSHLLTFVKQRIARYAYARRASRPRSPASVEAGRSRAFDLTRALFGEMKTTCDAAAAELIVISVPRADGGPAPKRVADLVGFIHSDGISYVNLEDRFREAQAGGAELYYPLDGHWNPRGHSLVAAILYDYLESAHPKAIGAGS